MNKPIGRNDPCPCGSGKKYKQCCLSKEQQRNVNAPKAPMASSAGIPAQLSSAAPLAPLKKLNIKVLGKESTEPQPQPAKPFVFPDLIARAYNLDIPPDEPNPQQ